MRIDIKDLPLNLQKQALKKLSEEDARRRLSEEQSGMAKEMDCRAVSSKGNAADSDATAMDSIDSQGNSIARSGRVKAKKSSDSHGSGTALDGSNALGSGIAELSFAKELHSNEKRRSKYNARKVTLPMSDGTDHTFDSQHEANVYGELWLMEQAGEISDLKIQVPFELIPRQVAPSGKIYRPCNYIADFVYTDSEGNTIVCDAKGMKTDVYKLKRKLMLKIWGIEIREV